jgi:hypothetical protein
VALACFVHFSIPSSFLLSLSSLPFTSLPLSLLFFFFVQ